VAVALAATVQQRRLAWQLDGSLAAAQRHWWQHCGRKHSSSAAAAVALAAVATAACRQCSCKGGGRQHVGSATAAGMAVAAAATAVLPPRAAAMATKKPMATAMAGAQTTINNQLKAAAAMATETVRMTATMITMETKMAAEV
jgi:hypothetical protein